MQYLQLIWKCSSKVRILVLIKNIRKALLGKLNSVNNIYIFRKNLGSRSSCPDYFSRVKITFTYINTQFSRWERSALCTLSLSLSLSLCSLLYTNFLLVNSLTGCHWLFSLLCIHTFSLVEESFSFFLAVSFVLSSTKLFVCDITLWIPYLSLNFISLGWQNALAECSIIVFSRYNFQEKKQYFLNFRLLCVRIF